MSQSNPTPPPKPTPTVTPIPKPTPTPALTPTPIRPALTLWLFFTIATGVVYPAAVTGIAQALFPSPSNGSLIESQGIVVGSAWIGQSFHSPGYFWSRPSATSGHPYNASASGGSNLGPTNPALATAVRDRVAALRHANPSNDTAPIPVDLVTSSASGLDPHLSPAAAEYQVARVARVRQLPEDRIRALVHEHIEGRTFGLLGEPRVNVLRLNLALDALARAGT